MKKLPAKASLVLTIILCVSVLTISVGFSALSTSLSINGSAAFKPVGMIRVTAMDQIELDNATEESHNYTIDTVSALLDINTIDGYAIYQVTISNLGEVHKEIAGISAEIFSNDQMEYEIEGVSIGDVVKPRTNKRFTIKFKYKDNATIDSTRLNAQIKIIFDDYTPIFIPNYQYEALGTCSFSGPDNTLVGVCQTDTNGYVNTSIMPFSEENYQKNFVLKFKIKNMDSSRFTANKRDTIFNILRESDDKEYGKYPGTLLRIENGKWLLQGGDGRSSGTKVYFNKNELMNKELKIIRHNDNGTINLYYMIGDGEPVLLRNMTNLVKPFDTPLTFGANLEIDNITVDRYIYGTLEDLSFSFYADGTSLDELAGKNDEPDDPIIEPTIPPVFAVTGPCIFNGANSNMTGDSCADYSEQNYINTGIYLYNSDNYEKDFDVSFNIDEYNNSNQEVAQVTLINAFLERTGRGYGFLLRKSNNNLSLIARDGNGNDKEVTLQPGNIEKFRIVRKNKKICYSINDDPFVFLIDNSNFAAPFDVPVTIGASLDQSRNPFRYIKGTLSNISIHLGEVNSDVNCE